MYEEFADMLVEFGIPILVYLPADGEGGHLEHGTWVKDPESPPVEVSEPLVVPSKTSLYSMEVQHNAGGETQSYDAVWYSTMEVREQLLKTSEPVENTLLTTSGIIRITLTCTSTT